MTENWQEALASSHELLAAGIQAVTRHNRQVRDSILDYGLGATMIGLIPVPGLLLIKVIVVMILIVKRCVISSHDVVVYENLKVRNLVKNHCLAKSINDAGWYQFRTWLEYFGKVFGRIALAVEPAYTSQE